MCIYNYIYDMYNILYIIVHYIHLSICTEVSTCFCWSSSQLDYIHWTIFGVAQEMTSSDLNLRVGSSSLNHGCWAGNEEEWSGMVFTWREIFQKCCRNGMGCKVPLYIFVLLSNPRNLGWLTLLFIWVCLKKRGQPQNGPCLVLSSIHFLEITSSNRHLWG
jgi:hypothetical protein